VTVDPAVLSLLQQLTAENHRMKRTGLAVVALLSIAVLAAWVAQDPQPPQPSLVPVQQALRTGKIELTNLQGKVVAVLQAVERPGEFVVGYHPNGVKSFEAQMKDGNYHGPYCSWWPDGMKSNEGVYLDGRRHGLWASYADRTADSGILKAALVTSRGNYQKGVKTGKWEGWHANGKKRSEGEYDEKGAMAGDWQFWNPDGSVDAQKTGKYENGKRVQ
jgi:antitoxin component YwqK of YwqJK toxin-antitoxin module